MIAAAMQLLFYVLLFARLAFYKAKHYSNESDDAPAVSVVICSRNDAANLEKALKLILIQLYKKFEVVVVNDRSTDNTLEVVAHFATRTDNVRVFTIPAGSHDGGKKEALKLGVAQARNQLIVVTDADCRPSSTHWLNDMVASYFSESEMVLGYAPFYPRPTLLNRLQRYENVMTAMQYFSFALSGMPYMGVGRNLSFRKDVFLNWAGTKRISGKIAGGDDDLFVNAVASGKKTEICLTKDSFVYSELPATWNDWMIQKRRHIRAGFYYRTIHRLLLFFFALSKFLFYTLLPVLCIKSAMQPFALAIAVVTMLFLWFISFKIHKKLHQTGLSAWFIPLDPAYALYLMAIFFLTSATRKDPWKEHNPQQR
ncbi:MAG: glycosyltransferase [Chitinophagales bacterium]